MLGVNDLLQMVLWVAEEQQLMANPKKLAAGTVIEAHLDKRKGPMATLLVQSGTLNTGEILAAGASFGKVSLTFDAVLIDHPKASAEKYFVIILLLFILFPPHLEYYHTGLE